MTLFIQKDTGSAGAGSVFPSVGSTHLIAISNMDAGYNETDLGSLTNLIQVGYTQSTTGPCPNRLNTLVNTDFGTPTGNRDILIVPSDNGFVRNDGVVVGPGVTLPPNSTLNPANSVVVIYDTTDNAGTGVCVKREGSSDMDVQSPPSVILYHELSHAFRICTSASLSSVEANCSSASPEENAAEIDENDMRDQLGIPHRDANNHCASVGCTSTGCCIVATVATGSPYSIEVNALRDVRDQFLRQSDVGYDFFEHLHTDYYTFSPEVCRMMSRTGELRSAIATYFVQPLSLTLRLIHQYTAEGCSAVELGERFNAAVEETPAMATLTLSLIDDLQEILGGGSVPSPPKLSEEVEDLEDLEALLRTRAHSSEFVKWALIDTLSIYLRAARHRLAGGDTAALGAELAAAIDAWAPDMPITDAWSQLSRYDRGRELEFLARALLRTSAARRSFGERLLAHFNGAESMRDLLFERGFMEEDVPWQS